MTDIDKLGRYDIVRVLGRGAMGVVYEGRDPNLERPVAIKTIRMQGLSAQAFAEYQGRFRTEARSVARLHHPNIVSVFDSGQDGEVAYLVMELIDGEDLKHHLECGARFSVRSAIVMVHELLMALDHAHRQNVVHRDIKPANMLMEQSGRVKLTDFGVARIQEPDEAHLTQVGGAVGTPKYMSPEQAKGLRGDSRSDIFSAGVVLYELLTGKLPFEGDNQFVVIHQIISHDPPGPSTFNAAVPVQIDAVLARALAKEPEARYATAREFALELRAAAAHVTESTNPNLGVGAELATGATATPAPALEAALRDGSSTGIFGPTTEAGLVSTVSHEAELAAWNGVRDSVQVSELEGFLALFPAGIYARRAQQRLDELHADAQNSSPPTSALSQPGTDADLDTTLAGLPPEPKHASAPLAWAAGALLVLLLAGGAWWAMRSGSQGSEAVPTPAASDAVALPQLSVSAPLAAASAEGSVAALASASAAVPSVSAPAAGPASRARPSASRPLRAPSTPVPAPSAAPAPSTTSQAPAPAPVSSVAPPDAPVAVQRGPSAPGEVCAERVFLARIACVAEQCRTERYRPTRECSTFFEMERAREENRRQAQ